MQVDSVGSGEWATEPQERNSAQVVQDVFSEALAAAGREGYASAEAVSDDGPLSEQIVTSWTDWFDGENLSGRYQNKADAEGLKDSYGEILVRAYEEGGYADPQTFLNSLSSEELGVVQKIHSLADPIRVDELTVEGAVNLLVPPSGPG